MTTDQPTLAAQECYCLACGYSLRGLERSGRCPECGRAFDLDEPATFTDQPVHGPPKPIGIGIAIGTVAMLGATGLVLLTLVPYSYALWPMAGASLLASIGAAIVLIVASVWVHRRLSLPMLPWLIAYWIIVQVLPWIGTPLMAAFIDRGALPAGHTVGTFVSTWSAWWRFLCSLRELLVIFMLMSEAAFLVSRMVDHRPRVMRLLLAARQHAAAFGIALIGLTVLNPILILLLWLL